MSTELVLYFLITKGNGKNSPFVLMKNWIKENFDLIVFHEGTDQLGR